MSGNDIQAFETTVGRVADALARMRVPEDRIVTVVVQPDDWLTKARQESRRRVVPRVLLTKILTVLLIKHATRSGGNLHPPRC